ncbi:MAG: hypothetical protein NC117_07700 [Pseudoflavonifractor sp.]|nr:hypothetical protein [Pseudoflavonifractor sp.]
MNPHTNRYTTRLIVAAAIMTASVDVAMALSLDEAKEAYLAGEYEKALPVFMTELEAKPRDGALNQWVGVCLMRTGQSSEALPYLKAAESRGIAEAPRYLAELALDSYDVDAASNHMESYRRALKKARKEMTPEGEDLDNRIQRMSTALERVEKIVVIDSMAVDRDTFFKAYRLSPESGRLNSADILPKEMKAADPTVVYTSENGRYMAWAMPDDTDTPRLMSSQLLADGTWDTPVPMGDELGEGGDANYPFIMSDGITLYYANDGENSLGGLDIFISRRDNNGFLQPQNIGMPYNSPYDDYMLAIDELTGVGWWATDRNRLDDKITIYKFIPSDLRINYPTDEPGLLSYARLDNYRDTWEPGKDYSDLLAKIDRIDVSKGKKKEDFRFALPDGRILTIYSQLPGDNARDAMRAYLGTADEIAATESRLADMRMERNLDRGGILSLEKRLNELRDKLRSQSNNVVRACRR